MRRPMLHALMLVRIFMFPQSKSAAFKKGKEAYELGDWPSALKVWRRLAIRGHAEAQAVLGAMYAKGYGVPLDLVCAHMWVNLVAAQGVALAADVRKELESILTDTQLARAQTLALKWNRKRKRA